MISKETYDKMQEYKALGLSMLKATEKLGISYNTTYKWWNKTDEEFTAFQNEHEFVLSAYLLYRYGEDTARKYLLHRSYKTYLKRALEIREEQTHG